MLDICTPFHNGAVASTHQDEETEISPLKIKKQDPQLHHPKQAINLMPGMVLLKDWLTKEDQINIVKTCRELGVGEGGFYHPGFGYGSHRKMHLWMMCLGKNWNNQSYSYEDRRSYDNALPPPIPQTFFPLVDRAIDSAHTSIRRDHRFEDQDVQDILPSLHPDVCIVNFYKESGRLGMHQDKDESRRSIQLGLPVVSFSIGDSAEFLYGKTRDVYRAERVVLESGDVIIFGGASRMVYHSVAFVVPNTCPEWLLEQTGLRPGRLNLTFRQI